MTTRDIAGLRRTIDGAENDRERLAALLAHAEAIRNNSPQMALALAGLERIYDHSVR